VVQILAQKVRFSIRAYALSCRQLVINISCVVRRVMYTSMYISILEVHCMHAFVRYISKPSTPPLFYRPIPPPVSTSPPSLSPPTPRPPSQLQTVASCASLGNPADSPSRARAPGWPAQTVPRAIRSGRARVRGHGRGARRRLQGPSRGVFLFLFSGNFFGE